MKTQTDLSAHMTVRDQYPLSVAPQPRRLSTGSTGVCQPSATASRGTMARSGAQGEAAGADHTISSRWSLNGLSAGTVSPLTCPIRLVGCRLSQPSTDHVP